MVGVPEFSPIESKYQRPAVARRFSAGLAASVQCEFQTIFLLCTVAILHRFQKKKSWGDSEVFLFGFGKASQRRGGGVYLIGVFYRTLDSTACMFFQRSQEAGSTSSSDTKVPGFRKTN